LKDIRLLSFELGEGFTRAIKLSKDPEFRQFIVDVELNFCFYEAVFEANLWEQFSATLPEDETDLLWEYVAGQTIDVSDKRSEEEERRRVMEFITVNGPLDVAVD